MAVKIITVYRDRAMYDKCVARNPALDGCELVGIDNRKLNESITVQYNRFLNGLSDEDDSWLVFCHEDFEFRGSPLVVLRNADKGSIHGPIGGVLETRRHWLFGEVWSGVFQGRIWESEKDGSGAALNGCAVPAGTIVDTVDCQCLIVHSSLVARHHLRFDENLTFDLYAEDFCAKAYLEYGVSTRILPVDCQHYSHGTIATRFFTQLAYLDRKYPKYEVFGSVGYMIGGGRTSLRRLQKRVRRLLDVTCPWLAVRLVHLSSGKK